jgi:uncharacterized protein YjbJ (UPF0337 family)
MALPMQGALLARTPNQTLPLMNALIAKGNWNVVKGKLKQKWGNLTDNDLTYIEGQDEELIGRIQKRTGVAKDAIEKYLKEDCGCR